MTDWLIWNNDMTPEDSREVVFRRFLYDWTAFIMSYFICRQYLDTNFPYLKTKRIIKSLTIMCEYTMNPNKMPVKHCNIVQNKQNRSQIFLLIIQNHNSHRLSLVFANGEK